MMELPIDVAARPVRTSLFSLRGRLGRVRYTAYTFGAIVVVFLLMLAAGIGLPQTGRLGVTLYVVFGFTLYYVVLPVVFAMLTIRRAHDFNCGGWIALLLLAPFVNLLFWFIPGSRQENRYGEVTQQEPAAVKVAAFVLPLLVISAFFSGPPPGRETAAVPVPAAPSTSLKPYAP